MIVTVSGISSNIFIETSIQLFASCRKLLRGMYVVAFPSMETGHPETLEAFRSNHVCLAISLIQKKESTSICRSCFYKCCCHLQIILRKQAVDIYTEL